MLKIKEIRKIESNIKEIKSEKIESLDDEFEDDSQSEDFSGNFGGIRRFNKTATLDASEIPQDTAPRERRISKEDEKEISFRPSYTGATQRGSAYTPVGSAESSSVSQTRTLGQERSIGENNQLQQAQNNNQQNGEKSGERAYVQDVKENDDRRDRRRNMM